MAAKAKYYPVLPYTKRSRTSDVLFGGPRANKSRTETIRDRRTQTTWANEVLFLGPTADSTLQVVGTDSASYTNNPGWRVTIAKGGDATSSYTRTIAKIGVTTYNVSSRSIGGYPYRSVGRGTIVGHYDIDTNTQVALAPQVEDQALARLKSKLNGYIGSVQLGPPLAESREIHRLVRQINGLGMETFKALLAAKQTKGKSVVKQAADIWLGFGFGVNPLLKDVKGAADSILKYITRQDQRVVVRGTAHTDWMKGAKNLHNASPVCYGTNLLATAYSEHTYGCSITAGIDLTMRSSASYSVAEHLGLEVGQLPSILWELTTLSWAADYFATVGPWLEDMFYVLPGTCKYVSKATKYQCRTTVRYDASAIAAYSVNALGGGGPVSSKYVAFARTKLSALPSRGLRIKSADEIASHGITKILNLASVIAGRRIPNL